MSDKKIPKKNNRLKHDEFFKDIMANKIVGQEFCNYYLPENIKNIIDLESIKIEQESFVEEPLRKRMSDIVYSMKTKDEKPALAYFLCEHQSSVDHEMPLRLMGYVMLLAEKYKRKEKNKRKIRLPLIFPIVIYVRHEVAIMFCCTKRQPNILLLVTYEDMHSWERLCVKLFRQCTPYREIAIFW